jgi:hypothetical protein
MAYVIGLLTPEEEAELDRRGWEIEEAPKELVPTDPSPGPGHRMAMVWVDQDMFNVMDGPDWEKGPARGDCPHGRDPDQCPEEECFDKKQAKRRAAVARIEAAAAREGVKFPATE